ncbi:MAG: hemerythrin domain-containing protein [Planctomycetes bacterium]|nr:hemerythrin domain-containing protein [Planctomycetota bacterium]
MNAKSRAERSRQQILDDHREIGALMSKVLVAGSAADMVECLGRLQPLLQRHFEEEEAEVGGLHATIVANAPRHSSVLPDLQQQHANLLERVGQVAAAATRPGAAIGDLTRLAEQLRSELAAHEAAETEIFVDSIWTDLGAGD